MRCDDRHVGNFDKREIGEGEAARYAEHHRLGKIETLAPEERGHDPAFAMGVLPVFQGHKLGHSLLAGKVSQPVSGYPEEARVLG
jgi:hypothetical protein